MAEYALKSILKSRGEKGVKVTSAGISACDGDKINEKALIALKNRGISAKHFVSKKITAETVKKQNAVVCMTAEQKRVFVGFNNVYCINELTGSGDIPDPFGQSNEVYEKTLDVIFAACEKIADLLIKENRYIEFNKEQQKKQKEEKAAQKMKKIQEKQKTQKAQKE